jgi:hypothetical protein
MLRSLLLFVHVLSAMGVFAGVGMEGAALWRLRSGAGHDDLGAVLGGFRAAQRVAMPSMLVLLLSGIYLATAYWRWRGPWMGLAFLGIVVMIVVGRVMTGRGLARLARGVTGPGLDSASARAGDPGLDPALRASFVIRTAMLVGIVFLMTVKPGAGTSLVALGSALAIALLASLPALRARPTGVTREARRVTP